MCVFVFSKLLWNINSTITHDIDCVIYNLLYMLVELDAWRSPTPRAVMHSVLIRLQITVTHHLILTPRWLRVSLVHHSCIFTLTTYESLYFVFSDLKTLHFFYNVGMNVSKN